MSKDSFNFKKFTIKQDKCAMKVGTDGVLLGAWANIPSNGKIADIGTGTGLLAIMAAQRSITSTITGIEIDEAASHQACDNMKNSPWSDRLSVVTADVNDFYHKNISEFDCILSNPPYFSEKIKSNKENRNIARHTDSLSFIQLAVSASYMLKEGGNFCIILPSESAFDFISETLKTDLRLKKRTDIITKTGGTPKRVMMEFVKGNNRIIAEYGQIVLNCNGEKSEEYRNLTDEFYL